MIVIATHDGKQFIENMLNSLHLCQHNERIMIVDTQSSEEYFNYLQTELKSKYPKIELCQTPYKGYDSGAYIFAYKNFIDEHYIFLHDSIIITDNDMIVKLLNGIDDDHICSLVGFGGGGVGRNYDNLETENFVLSHCKTVEFKDGIFGPMFAIKRITMNILSNNNRLIIPSNKSEQRAMERLWSVIANIHNIGINSLSRYNTSSWSTGDYGMFKKIHTYVDRK